MQQMSCLIGVLLVVVSASVAQAEPAGKEVLTQQLIKASGLEQQIAQIPAQIFSGIAAQKAAMSAEQYNTLLVALKEAFHVQRLTVNVSARIEKNLDLETMRAALTWLHSDLGMKITGLEEAASTPQGIQQLQAYAQKLPAHPAPPIRLQLAERLDAVTHSTDMTVNIIMATMLGVATAIDAAQLKERRIGAEALKAQLELQHPAFLQTYRPMVTASILYIYQGLDDAEMKRYIAFFESPPGRDYQATVNAALIGALSDSSERLGNNLAEAVKHLDKKQGV